MTDADCWSCGRLTLPPPIRLGDTMSCSACGSIQIVSDIERFAYTYHRAGILGRGVIRWRSFYWFGIPSTGYDNDAPASSGRYVWLDGMPSTTTELDLSPHYNGWSRIPASTA